MVRNLTVPSEKHHLSLRILFAAAQWILFNDSPNAIEIVGVVVVLIACLGAALEKSMVVDEHDYPHETLLEKSDCDEPQ